MPLEGSFIFMTRFVLWKGYLKKRCVFEQVFHFSISFLLLHIWYVYNKAHIWDYSDMRKVNLLDPLSDKTLKELGLLMEQNVSILTSTVSYTNPLSSLGLQYVYRIFPDESRYHSNYLKKWLLLFQIRGSVVVLRDRILKELGDTIDPNQQWLS